VEDGATVRGALHEHVVGLTMGPKFIAGLVDVLQRTVNGPRVAGRFAALEMRIAELEARPVPSWAGTHAEGKTYSECAMVTHRGGLWLATRATVAPPGSGPDWKLIVKRGGYDA
jgi:hypothetical protein